MKNKHIQYIFFLFVFTILLDYTFGSVYDGLFFSKESMANDRLIHSAIGTKEDILIFGSSRANHHYNPDIIEQQMKMTCYNLGRDGQNIYYHLALLKSAIQNAKPKIAILDLITIDFEKTLPQYDMEKLGVFLPFADRNEILRKTVLMRGTDEKFKLISNIYPFNSQLHNILRNYGFGAQRYKKGFSGLTNTWNKKLEIQTKTDKTEIDSNKINAIFQFIELCQTNHINIHIYISPYYVDLNGNSDFANLSAEIKSKFGIEVHDFEQDKYFLSHPDLFNDPYHLNIDGANLYTHKVIELINKARASNTD